MRSKLFLMMLLTAGDAIVRESGIGKELLGANKNLERNRLQGDLDSVIPKIKPGKTAWETKFRK